jgi:HAD superfamily hydrolase (TIGR01509 family)
VRFAAVLFDVGDTLLHVPQDPHKRALQSVQHLGRVDLNDYKQAIVHAQAQWQDAGGPTEHEDLPETWIGHTKRALEILGFGGDSAAAAGMIEHSFLKDGWELYPEVVEALTELQQRGIRMGVISNWPPSLEATLEAVGLKQYFEVVVASGVVGYAKPRPEIFRVALRRMKLEPKAALFVGDKFDLDIEGAAAVGMPSMLIDRENRFPGHRDRISSLRELLVHVV